MKLFEQIGEPATLEQMAEECAELAQACLKAARAWRGESPTPKSDEEIKDNIEEEMADVLICMTEITEAKLVDPKKVHEWEEKKRARLAERFGEVRKTMEVIRPIETETDRIQVGDRIRLLGGYTATCQQLTETGALMLVDQYVAEKEMNEKNTNEGGWQESDLRKFLIDITDEFIPNELLPRLGKLETGDYIRIPYLGEMVEELPDWAEEDGKKMWPSMADKRNRLAFHKDGRWDWCWCMNKVADDATNFCNVHFNGSASSDGASGSSGVRPAFLIIQ